LSAAILVGHGQHILETSKMNAKFFAAAVVGAVLSLGSGAAAIAQHGHGHGHHSYGHGHYSHGHGHYYHAHGHHHHSYYRSYYYYPRRYGYGSGYHYYPRSYVVPNRAPFIDNSLNYLGGEIIIRNPKTSPGEINYLLNGYRYVIRPGESQRIIENRRWTIRFDRGRDSDVGYYVLHPGTYTFKERDGAWELYRRKSAANGG